MIALKHQSKEQFMARFRQRYRDSSGEQNAFNLGIVGWTTLKQKMQDWVNKYDSVQAAQGE